MEFVVLALSAALVVAFALKYQTVAWLCFVTSFTLNGVVTTVGSATVRPEMFAFPLLLITLLHNPGIKENRFRSGSMITLAIAFLLTAMFTTVLNAPQPLPSLWILLQIALGLVAFLMLSASQVDKARLVNLATIPIGIVAAWSLLNLVVRSFIALPLSGVAPDGRLLGFSYETNIFASQCVGWLAVLYYWRSDLSRQARRFAVVLILAVAAAGTRAAWLALGLIGLVVLIRAMRRSALVMPAVLLLAVSALPVLELLTLASASSTPDSLVWRLNNILNTDEGTGAYRVETYDLALSDITSVPRFLFGSGLNTFSQFHTIDSTGVTAAYLSSIWFALLYDVGIVGSVLFFAVLLQGVRLSWKPLDTAALLAVLLICASATNLIWFQYPWVYLGLVLYKRAPLDEFSPHLRRVGRNRLRPQIKSARNVTTAVGLP